MVVCLQTMLHCFASEDLVFSRGVVGILADTSAQQWWSTAENETFLFRCHTVSIDRQAQCRYVAPTEHSAKTVPYV